jgi:hypothetical protein
LRVCKTINREASPIFYGENEFRFTSKLGSLFLDRFLSTIGAENIRALKHVSLYVPLDFSKESYEFWFYNNLSSWDKNVISKYIDSPFNERLVIDSRVDPGQLKRVRIRASINALEQLRSTSRPQTLSLTIPTHHSIYCPAEAALFHDWTPDFIEKLLKFDPLFRSCDRIYRLLQSLKPRDTQQSQVHISIVKLQRPASIARQSPQDPSLPGSSPEQFRHDKLHTIAEKNGWEVKTIYYDPEGRFFDTDPDPAWNQKQSMLKAFRDAATELNKILRE